MRIERIDPYLILHRGISGGRSDQLAEGIRVNVAAGSVSGGSMYVYFSLVVFSCRCLSLFEDVYQRLP